MMIRHIFMWQAAEPHERQPILDLLARLSDRLPMIRSWELGGHQGEPNDNGDPWDGALVTDFDSWEDLDAYSTDPFHDEIVQELLPKVRSRAVVDFVREGAYVGSEPQPEAEPGELTGRLSVGVIPTVTAVDVPAALKAFRRAHPHVHIALQVSGSEELESAINRGDLDIGLLGLPENRAPRDVASRHLGSDRLVVVVSHDHALADRREVSLSDLAKETFADFPAGTPARAESDQAFAAAGIDRDVAFESMAIGITIDLIRQNLAIALLPSRYAPYNPTLARLPITDGPSRAEYLAWSNAGPSPAAQAFLDILNGTDSAY